MCNSGGISGVRSAKAIRAAFGKYEPFQLQNRPKNRTGFVLLSRLAAALVRGKPILCNCTCRRPVLYCPTMKKYLVFPLLAGALFLAGCGKKDEATASASAAPAPAAAPAAPAGAVIELTANDSMKFSATHFEVSAGQEVKVTLTNLGTTPKVAMGHNFVLLKKGEDPKAFADAAIMAAGTDYIPANLADKIIAHTKLLGPKQSDEITFKAPTEPGEYPFLCSFPAHFLTGMKGVIVVK
jgi:azurin